MSSLQQRKKSKEKEPNKTFSKENNSDWKSYGLGVLNSLIYLTLFSLIGFGFLYSIKHLASEKFLPTNVSGLPYNPTKNMPFSRTLPYVPYNTTNPTVEEALSRIIGGSMAFVRSILKIMFQSLSHLNETRKLTYIDYILFIFSGLITVITTIFLPWLGLAGGFLEWFNLGGDIFVKVVSFLLLGLILFPTFLYQHFYMTIFLIFALYQMKQDNMFGFYAKQMRHFFYILIVLSVLLPAFGTLWYPFIIGMVISAIIPYIRKLI